MGDDGESKTFSYVRYDDVAQATQAQFKKAFEALERMVMTLKSSRPRSLVMTELEVAYMWVGKAIRDDQYERDHKTTDAPERG